MTGSTLPSTTSEKDFLVLPEEPEEAAGGQLSEVSHWSLSLSELSVFPRSSGREEVEAGMQDEESE